MGCGVKHVDVYSALFRRVEVNELRTSTLVQIWGAFFEETVLSGAIGRLMISPSLPPGLFSVEVQGAFDEDREAFYDGVDWALDIQEAVFKEFQVEGIPVNKIRRDPETQVVVS